MGPANECVKLVPSAKTMALEIEAKKNNEFIDSVIYQFEVKSTSSYTSGTTSSLITDFHSSIKKKITQGMPVLGTCAGLIFLSNQIVQNSSNTSQKLLGSLDIETERNAFGRQHESFQSEFPIPKFGLDKFTGVFIRAPRIRNIGSNVEILAKLNDEIVAVKQGNIIGTCFHPELSNTVIFHKYLIELVRETL